MATATHPAAKPSPHVLEVPDPVKKFGQDDGRFYHCYDTLADEIDEDMTSALKEQLDGLLVFAGLFAGVNTAFLALTLPLMTADPTADTNALLLRNNAMLLDILQGRNESSWGSTTLPSSAFSPSKDIFVTNTLFALSLAVALISSFLAVLGRQWLVYYRKRGGGSPERQRLDQIDRFIGAEKWHLELILDDLLPSLLQVGLVLFCVSLVVYLRTINSPLCWIIGSSLGAAFAILIVMAICAGWDRFCPFQSPLSRFASWCMFTLPLHLYFIPRRVLLASINLLIFIAVQFASFAHWLELAQSPRRFQGLQGKLRWASQALDRREVRQAGTSFAARQEGTEELHVTAIKRIISRSDDVSTLLHAVANIFAVRDRSLLAQLMTGGELRGRLLALKGDIYHGIMRLGSSHGVDIAPAAARLVDAALAHIVLSMPDDVEAEVAFFWLSRSVRYTAHSIPSTFPLGTHLIPSSSPFLLEAHLAHTITLRELGHMTNDQLNLTLCGYSEHLASPNWKIISLLAMAIAIMGSHANEPVPLRFVVADMLHDPRAGWRRKLRAAYVGDVGSALISIESAISNIMNLQEMDPDSDVLHLLLVRILKSAHQAAFDKEGNPSVEAWEVSAILRLTERYIRVSGGLCTLTEVRSKHQVDLLKTLQDSSLRLIACKRVPISLADHFVSLFEPLNTSTLHLSKNENEVDILQSFGTIFQGLFELEPPGWQDPADGAVAHPEIIDGRLRVLQKTYNIFKRKVDRASYVIKRSRRADWDPEIRWCHWSD